MYLDVNALYSWAMTQPLTFKDFIEMSLEEIHETFYMDNDAISKEKFETVSKTQETGCMLEVDLIVLRDSHNKLNDLPPCIEKRITPGLRLPELIATLS